MPHLVNHTEADVLTATAGSAMDLGQVCKVTAASGLRQVDPLGDTDDALVLPGNYCIVMKWAAIDGEVDSSTAAARLGDRTVTIATGDKVAECRRGSIVEYAADELGDSLNPAEGGTIPAAMVDLGVSAGKWATIAAATSAGIATPVIGRVHQVFGSGQTARVQIELL